MEISREARQVVHALREPIVWWEVSQINQKL